MKNIIIRCYQVMLLVCICVPNISGQEYYNIPLSSAKYFDNHNTYNATVDTNNILWVGTTKGLYRFDGGQSINAKNFVKGWEELSDAFVYHVHCDPYNKLWINTKSEGIAVIDLSTLQATRIEINNKKGAKINEYNIQYLSLDENYAWASIWNSNDILGGILKINLKDLSTEITPMDDVIVPGILHQDLEDKNTLWITGESLSKFDKTTSLYTEIEYDSTINAEHLVDITENGHGDLFIAFKNANDQRKRNLLRFNKKSSAWISDEEINPLDFSINFMGMYNDSLLLLTTTDDIELQMYNTYSRKLVDWSLKKDLLRSEGSVKKISNGEFVISGFNTNYLKHTQNAYGTILLEPNEENLNPSYYGNGHYLNDKYIFPQLGKRDYYLELDTNNLGTTRKEITESYNYRALYKIEDTRSLAVARDAIATIDHNTGKVNTLMTIAEYLPEETSTKFFYNSTNDLDGNVWISTSHNSILEYNIKTSKIEEYKMPSEDGNNSIFIFDVTADPEGNIFAAGRFQLFYKSVEDSIFTPLLESFPDISLPENLIPYSIASNKINEILLGTWAKGTYKINTSKSEVKRIGPEFNNVFVESIRVLSNNKFAILGRYYLAIYNSDNDKFKILTAKDGINELPLRNPSTLHLRGRDAITFDGKLYTFDTDSLLTGANQNIEISRIVINGENRSLDETLTLNHKEDNIIINYALSEYDIYNQVKYRYSLENQSETWIDLGNRKELMFSNLSPGDYNLKIQSTNIDGFWIDNIKTVQFKINPPWYKTLWFKILSLTALLLLLWSILKFYINYQKRNLEYDKRFAQLETMILKSQMNPHFIFNSLNSIRYLFMKDQKDKGLKYITKFAKLLRSTLHHGEHALVKLSDEIELTELFIELEQLRFEDKFEFTANYDKNDDWRNIDLPPFVIQPLVENAFWHGLSQSKKVNKELKIEIQKEGNQWLIHVNDNGVGMGNSKSSIDTEVGKKKSYGLSLIQERFDLINTTQSTQYDITIVPSTDNEGTNITISITLNS